MGKETGKRIGDYVQRNVLNLVFAASVGGVAVAAGGIGAEKMGKANDLNNQIHSASAERSLKLQDEFSSEFWLGYYFLIAAVGSAGVAGVTIYSAIKSNPSSSAS